MTQTSHQLARDFFAALESGHLSTDLLTDDMTAWTTTSGAHNSRERYTGGVQMLAAIFPAGLQYTIHSLTAEDDRVVAEVESSGILSNGESFGNHYVFVLRIREGRIASVAEHFNPDPVRTQIAPLIQAMMVKSAD